MQISVIAIGDELLIGQVTDTNSGAIARRIAPLGWNLHDVQVVGDDATAIRRAIERAMAASPVVITTGGLGPTKDDITKGVMADIFGGPMIYDEAVAANVREVFEKRGLSLNRLTRTQAMVPASCRVIQNVLGTAPIMVFERDGRMVLAMPGVPFETLGMLDRAVLPMLIERYHDGTRLMHHTLMVSGITESDLAERLEPWEAANAAVHLAYLPTPGFIKLRLDAALTQKAGSDDTALFDNAVASLRQQVEPWLLYDGDASPGEILVHRAAEKGCTLATAESCTGGTIASRITAIPGASQVYVGGVVAYSNDVKRDILGVKSDTLAQYGAVSEEVVRQMAAGVCERLGADCSVVTSGIAGPTGGTPEKPVGTVWMAVCCRGQISTRVIHLPGSRARVIDRAATEAIIMLTRNMQ